MRPAILVVTHVTPYPPGAGNEQRIFRLLSWLRDEGYQVTLVLRPTRRPTLVQRRALRALVDRLVWVPIGRPGSYWLASPRQRSLDDLHQLRDALYNSFGGPYYTRWIKPVLAGAVRTVRAAASSWGAVSASGRQPTTTACAAGQPGASGAAPGSADAIEDALCPPWLIDEVARECRRQRPFAVIAEYIWLSRCLEAVPAGVLKLIDSHDVFSRRATEVVARGVPDAFAIDAEQELAMLRRCDVAIAIHDGERQIIEGMGLDRRVITTAIDVDFVPARRRPIAGRILCVASDNQVNRAGIQAFLRSCWPTIRDAHPGATLHIVGRVTRHLWESGPRVHLTGFVRELADAYADAEIVVNPVIGGTGLKVKTIEALGHGKPLVVWPNGADGLDASAGLPCLMASDWADFSAKVGRLLVDAELRDQLAARAHRHVTEHYGRAAVYRSLGEVLARAAASRPEPGVLAADPALG